MSDKTTIYNEAAERRRQSLDFVGQDRRKIIQNAEAQQAQETNNQVFLSKITDIDGVKRIA